MSTSRRTEITYHLNGETIDKKLTEADDDHIVRRLSFVKNLYLGDTLKDATERVGRSEATGSRWAEQWNEGGLAELAPPRDHSSIQRSCLTHTATGTNSMSAA